MSETLKAWAVALGGLVLLDGLWLGVLMRSFYREQLGPIARMSEGGLAPIWPVAALVYVLLALGIAVFVTPRAGGLGSALAFGALFGLVAYGVYDLTNHSTLARWPTAVTLTDIAWGTVSCAVVAAATWALVAR
jgi:uncharacterized membrane protein